MTIGLPNSWKERFIISFAILTTRALFKLVGGRCVRIGRNERGEDEGAHRSPHAPGKRQSSVTCRPRTAEARHCRILVSNWSDHRRFRQKQRTGMQLHTVKKCGVVYVICEYYRQKEVLCYRYQHLYRYLYDLCLLIAWCLYCLFSPSQTFPFVSVNFSTFILFLLFYFHGATKKKYSRNTCVANLKKNIQKFIKKIPLLSHFFKLPDA